MRRAPIAAALLTLVSAGSAAAQPGTAWSVTTDQSVYVVGEPVVATVEVCNLGAEVVTVDANVGVSIFNAGGTPVWSQPLLPWVNWTDIPAGECVVAVETTWDQRDFDYLPVPPGTYWAESFDCVSGTFEIVQPQVEAIPISNPAIAGLAGLLLCAGVWLLRRPGH